MSHELDPKLQALLKQDPRAFFEAIYELRMQGTDPVAAGILPSNPVTKKVKSPDRWAKQQIDNAAAAGADWLDGVKNPSRDPVAAAIDKNDKRKDRLAEAEKEERWLKSMRKVTPQDIIAVADALGTGVYTSGVTARSAKITRRVAELQPLAQSVSDTIQNLPDKTDADRVKRLITARELMKAVGQKRRA